MWAETQDPPIALTPAKCDELAISLINYTDGPIVTFNGAGFDFRVLCAHVTTNSLRRQLVKVACFNHIDIMMDFLCSSGYPSSLESFLTGACFFLMCYHPHNLFCFTAIINDRVYLFPFSCYEGCKLSGKTWAGHESAKMCLTNYAYFQKTIEYCTNDVIALKQLYEHVKQHGALERTTKAGNTQTWVPFNGTEFRTVSTCITQWDQCPVDTSWMETPGITPNDSLKWILELSSQNKL